MTLRQYLFLMFVTTAMCWLGFGAVVRGVDPMSGGWVALALFYLSLTLALAGTFGFIGTLIRARVNRHESAAKHVGVAVRQSLILTALFVAALAMLGHTGLSWGRLVLLIGIASLVEVFLANVSTRKASV